MCLELAYFEDLFNSQSCSKCSDLGNELWLCLGQNNFCVSNCCCPGSIRLSFLELIKPDFLRSTLLRSNPTLHKTGMSKTVPLQERNTKALCFVTCIAMLSPHLLTQSVLGLKWTCEPGCWQPYVAAMLPTPSKGKHPAIVAHCSKCPVATKTGCHSKLLEHRWWCSFGCFAQEFGRTGSQAPANPRLHVDEGSLTPYGPCTSLSQVRFEIQ